MSDLKAKVLDKLAKEFKIEREVEKQIWKEIPQNYCFGKKQVERAVVLTLEAKQAEIEKVINEIKNMKLIQTGTVTASVNLLLWTYKKDKKFRKEISLSEFVDWLEKRLQANQKEAQAVRKNG